MARARLVYLPADWRFAGLGGASEGFVVFVVEFDDFVAATQSGGAAEREGEEQRVGKTDREVTHAGPLSFGVALSCQCFVWIASPGS